MSRSREGNLPSWKVFWECLSTYTVETQLWTGNPWSMRKAMKLSLPKPWIIKLETHGHNFGEFWQHLIEDLFYHCSYVSHCPAMKSSWIGAERRVTVAGPLWIDPVGFILLIFGIYLGICYLFNIKNLAKTWYVVNIVVKRPILWLCTHFSKSQVFIYEVHVKIISALQSCKD